MRKEDGGSDLSGKCRVLDDAESSLGNAVLLRTLYVGKFLFDAILSAHVPEISTNELSSVIRPCSLYLRRHTIRTHISQKLPECVSSIGLTLEKVYP